jgi:glucosamine--fructose-6-phosphate aminotransferase (isomerizing)
MVDGAAGPADRSAVLASVVDKDMTGFRLAVRGYHRGERTAAAATTATAADGGGAEITTVGIAHTRWATHGEPSETNAHPHVSNNGLVSVVHNGIIENRDELRDELRALGHVFHTETDTEVLPHLLAQAMSAGKGVVEAIGVMMARVRGAYGVAVTVRGDPRLYACRYGSPLCVGITGAPGEFFVASEPSAFLSYTNQIIEIEDHEIVSLGASGIEITRIVFSAGGSGGDGAAEDGAGTGAGAGGAGADGGGGSGTGTPVLAAKDAVLRRVAAVAYDLEEVQKGKYPFYMLKEIHAQPTAVQNAVSGKARPGGLETVGIDIPPRLTSISFVACGTSYHAAMIAGYIIENHVGIPVNCYYASEYINRACLLSPSDLVIAVSQSGSTADTRIALEHARDAGCAIAGVVNVVGSQIARLAGQGMCVRPCGPCD